MVTANKRPIIGRRLALLHGPERQLPSRQALGCTAAVVELPFGIGVCGPR